MIIIRIIIAINGMRKSENRNNKFIMASLPIYVSNRTVFIFGENHKKEKNYRNN